MWWVMFRRKCGELLYGKRFPLMLIGAAYKRYVGSVLLYGSKAWCLKKAIKEFCERRNIVRAMFGVQIKDTKKTDGFMSMLLFNETMDELSQAHSVHWYGHVLRREDDRDL